MDRFTYNEIADSVAAYYPDSPWADRWSLSTMQALVWSFTQAVYGAHSVHTLHQEGFTLIVSRYTFTRSIVSGIIEREGVNRVTWFEIDLPIDSVTNYISYVLSLWESVL